VGRAPLFLIIVFNLDRSRPTRRWRYTQGWTVFHLPSTPRSRPGALTVSPPWRPRRARRWQPRLRGLHRLASTHTRSRKSVFASVPSRGLRLRCAPSRQAGIEACDNFRRHRRRLERPASCYLVLAANGAHARQRYPCHRMGCASTSPHFLRRWIGAPSRGRCSPRCCRVGVLTGARRQQTGDARVQT